MGCKRPCFHDEFLPTFNRPNVTLVHTDGKGINQVKKKNKLAQKLDQLQPFT
jgi:hypothetical protein